MIWIDYIQELIIMVEICQCFVWRDEAPVLRMTWKSEVEDNVPEQLIYVPFFITSRNLLALVKLVVINR